MPAGEIGLFITTEFNRLRKIIALFQQIYAVFNLKHTVIPEPPETSEIIGQVVETGCYRFIDKCTLQWYIPAQQASGRFIHFPNASTGLANAARSV